MAIRTIEWTVQEDGMSLSPTVCQDGGVQGDHNKTRAEFVLPASLIEGYEFYVEYVDTFGGFDTTEQLTVEGDRVGVSLPLAWTQHGGEATLRLVATKEGETGYTLEGKVRYHSRAGLIEKVKALIDGCIQAMLTRTEKAADRIEAAEEALTAGEQRVRQAVENASAAKGAAEQALVDAQKAEKRAASVVGVYVGSGDMPDGYSVQIDPDGSVYEMDTELNEKSKNPVTNGAIARAVAELNTTIGALDVKLSRVMYGGGAVISSNASWTAEQFNQAIDAQLKTWWDAMPSYSIRFFILENGTNLSVLAPGGNLIRMCKIGSGSTSYGTIETYSYQNTHEGSGLRRSVWAGTLADEWEHWGQFRVDTIRVKSPASSLYAYSHVDGSTYSGDFGVAINAYDEGTYLEGSIVPHVNTSNMKTKNLGEFANPWTNVVAEKIYAIDSVEAKKAVHTPEYRLRVYSKLTTESLGTGYAGVVIDTFDDVIQLSGAVAPHKVGVQAMFLGTNANPWSNVYSTSGVSQTSSREAKENIKNVISELTPMTLGLDEETAETSDITVENVVDFVRNLQPVTFNYKENASPDAEQLGLIADDIAEHPIYKYIGTDQIGNVEVTPAEYDDEGNIVVEAETEEKRILGLQAVPLAVAALTTCKHLLNQLDNVYAINEDLQSQLDGINARLSALEG